MEIINQLYQKVDKINQKLDLMLEIFKIKGQFPKREEGKKYLKAIDQINKYIDEKLGKLEIKLE